MSTRLKLLLANLGQHALTGLPIGLLPCYLAVDAAGCPALAVPAASGGLSQIMETEYLSLLLFTQATVTDIDGNRTDGFFHLLSCKKGDPEVIAPFEALATAVAEGLTTADRTDIELYQAFDTLCELFRTKPVGDLARARTGLWGELFLMREMGGYTRMATFWHTEPGRKFDFANGPFRLEMKATTSADRTHTFAHGQLYTSSETEIVVGSLLLRYEDAGLSLAEMITEARVAFASDCSSLLKLEKAIRTVGMTNAHEDGPRFDVEEARDRMCFFRAQDLPHFPMAEPQGVSATTYRVSVGGTAPIPGPALKVWLDQWRQGN